MKRTVKLFAVIASLVATGLLASSGCTTNVVRYEKYANAELYTVGSASVSAEDVRKVEIDWVGGSIEIEQTTSQTVQVLEEVNAGERSGKESERMRYYLDGDVLKVKYCESGLRGNINTQNKELRVEIPAGIALDVDSVSASVTLGVVESAELSVESVSGNISAERIVCDNAEFETVSGKIIVGELIGASLSLESVSGTCSVTRLSVDALDAETVSGELTFGLQKALSAEIESTSADVTFTLGAGLGATLRLETATGKFRTEKEYGKTGSRYDVFGADGTSTDCLLEVDVFSGNVYIN